MGKSDFRLARMTCTFCYNKNKRCEQSEGSPRCDEYVRHQRSCDGPFDVFKFKRLSRTMEKLRSEEKKTTEELQRLGMESNRQIGQLDSQLAKMEQEDRTLLTRRCGAAEDATTQDLDSMELQLSGLQSRLSTAHNRLRRLKRQIADVEKRSSNMFARGMRDLDEEDGIVTYDAQGMLLNVHQPSSTSTPRSHATP